MMPSDLRAWMERMVLTKSSAARALGVSVRQIERYLNGTRGIPPMAVRLCACLERKGSER